MFAQESSFFSFKVYLVQLNFYHIWAKRTSVRRVSRIIQASCNFHGKLHLNKQAQIFWSKLMSVVRKTLWRKLACSLVGHLAYQMTLKQAKCGAKGSWPFERAGPQFARECNCNQSGATLPSHRRLDRHKRQPPDQHTVVCISFINHVCNW